MAQVMTTSASTHVHVGIGAGVSARPGSNTSPGRFS